MIVRPAIVVAVLTLTAAPTTAREAPRDFAGHAGVFDGDTLNVGGVRVRLNGIEAPERHQTCTNAAGKRYPCGEIARASLARIVEGYTLRCHALYVDRHTRTVATCFAGRSDIADLMVRSGQAVADRRDGTNYVAAEEAARAEHRGLWASRFQPPDEWRHERDGR